ncbi:hypothetical protein, partial [Elizabethkingia meningoseptica]|uniref:hypothetical protein n=2 Tax=Elizabethkingia TaxID=308865 RepID=UPI0023B06CDA
TSRNMIYQNEKSDYDIILLPENSRFHQFKFEDKEVSSVYKINIKTHYDKNTSSFRNRLQFLSKIQHHHLTSYKRII